MAIELGSKVKDQITGLVGIAVCRCVWLNGCVRIGVQPQVVKEGKPAAEAWIDEHQLQVIKAKKNASKPSGGPRPNPERHAAPVDRSPEAEV